MKGAGTITSILTTVALLVNHVNAQFKEPVLTNLNTGQRLDWGVTVSPDLLEAYFTSWRSDQTRDIWIARRESPDDDWGDFEYLEFVNSAFRDDSPRMSADGLRLLFASNRPDGFGGWDLYEATRNTLHDNWSEPNNLGPVINTSRDERVGTLSSDGLTVIYAGAIGGGQTMLMSSRDAASDDWNEPEFLSSRNGHEIGPGSGPSLSPDGLSLYFHSSRGDSQRNDIYVSRRESTSAPFGPAENLGPVINTNGEDILPFLAADGSLYYSRDATWNEVPWEIWRAEAEEPLVPLMLRAGDADQDLDFDQFDLVGVAQAGKYLTGEPATWGEGDWDGAPGGVPGSPPPGDGLFDQRDIITALAGGEYLQGPYAALRGTGQTGDAQSSVGYDANSGEIWVDAPAGTQLTSLNIDSMAGIFTGQSATSLGDSFDNDADDNIFKATFGGNFGSISFGNVTQPGLTREFVLSDLTVVGSLSGGGSQGEVDLVYIPEPSSAGLLALGLASVLAMRRRVRGRIVAFRESSVRG